MASANRQSTRSIRYFPRAMQRAERAVQCSPFRIHLFETMLKQRVALAAIAGNTGVQNGYTTKPLPELAAEADLMWLIQTGLLRREVDGQGITDSFRLTPLGRQLVEQWRSRGGEWSAPSWRDRLANALNRWVRLSGWLQ
ncbi:MAG: Npun_F0494 family protein [Elainellaceae cyanobacterium]